MLQASAHARGRRIQALALALGVPVHTGLHGAGASHRPSCCEADVAQCLLFFCSATDWFVFDRAHRAPCCLMSVPSGAGHDVARHCAVQTRCTGSVAAGTE